MVEHKLQMEVEKKVSSACDRRSILLIQCISTSLGLVCRVAETKQEWVTALEIYIGKKCIIND